MRKKYLNLFAGGGGNTQNLNREEFEVTHIEIDKTALKYLKEHYPEDTIIVKDAYEYLCRYFDDYDVVWASPPCNTHSRAKLINADKYKYTRELPDFRLYSVIAYLKHRMKKLDNKVFVVENTIPYYSLDYVPIKPDTKVGRHLIWSNVIIPPRSKIGKKLNLSGSKFARNIMDGGVADYIHHYLFNKIKEKKLFF